MRALLRFIPGLALAVFGFFCLNYTKAFGVDHHYEWAAETGAPEPAGWIYFLGVATLGLGAASFGYALCRSKAGRSTR